MDIRPITRVGLRLVEQIDVSEEDDTSYHQHGEELQVVAKTWRRPRWDAAQCARRCAEYATIMDAGGVVLGAFDGESLAGIASLRYRLTPDLAQLATLHVSRAYRRRKVARELVAEIVRRVREDGAHGLYVSATPSRSAVGFYRSQGFRPVAEPHPELFALEPDDIHMILPLDVPGEVHLPG